MATSLHSLDVSFGIELEIGPFESPVFAKQLLARYYHGDQSQTHDLPISDDALAAVWQASRGSPFLLQHIFDECFRVANRKRAETVSNLHVKLALESLAARKPRYFGSSKA